MAINGSGGMGNLWNGMGGGNMSFRLRSDRTPIVTGAEMAMTKWAGGGFGNNNMAMGWGMMNNVIACPFTAMMFPTLLLGGGLGLNGGFGGGMPCGDVTMAM